MLGGGVNSPTKTNIRTNINERMVNTMKLTLTLNLDNGPKEFETKELDFTNVMCDLEDNGVDVMAMLDDEERQHMKIFTTMRSIISVIVGEKDMAKAGKLLTEHLKNNGKMDTIMKVFTELMASAGFGKAEEETESETENEMATETAETTAIATLPTAETMMK